MLQNVVALSSEHNLMSSFQDWWLNMISVTSVVDTVSGQCSLADLARVPSVLVYYHPVSDL